MWNNSFASETRSAGPCLRFRRRVPAAGIVGQKPGVRRGRPGKCEEANLRGVLAVAFNFRRRVFIFRHFHAVLRHRPVEKPGKDFPVAVGGLRGEATACDLPADERRNLGRTDLLEA